MKWGLEGEAIIILTLLWSEIMSGYNTPDTMVETRSVKVGHEIMNEARVTIITVVAVDGGQSDFDTADIVFLFEVDSPPRICLVILGARMCVRILVNSKATFRGAHYFYVDLSCRFVG